MHDERFFPPETDVIVTSTISDRELLRFTFEDELRIIRALEPTYAIPFDFPVYTDMDPETRETHIKQHAGGVLDMSAILGRLTEDEITRICDVKKLPRELVEPVSSTRVLPLVKGTTPEERAIMYRVAEQIEPATIVKYGAQYMTVDTSGNYPALKRELERINTETDGYPTMVVGLLSPTGKYSLEHLPSNVVAAAGMNQWVKRFDPNTQTPAEMQSAYETFTRAVGTALGLETVPYRASITRGLRGTPPTELTKTPGNAVSSDLQPSIAGAATTGEYGFGQRKRPEHAADAVTAGSLGGQVSPDSS